MLFFLTYLLNGLFLKLNCKVCLLNHKKRVFFKQKLMSGKK